MEIRTLHYLEGAKKCTGLTVVIDVFRAFSTACYASANGAESIIPIADIDQAYQMKKEFPDSLLIGERGGIPLEGFDFGNSPSAIEGLDFSGKTVLMTTSAGTQGLTEAMKYSSAVLTGSFVNAEAIVRRIREIDPATVTLLCMGWNAKEPADEDMLCAQYLEHRLRGKTHSFSETVEFLKHKSTTKNFLNQLGRHPSLLEDFSLCLQLDRFPFALQAYGTHLLYLKKE